MITKEEVFEGDYSQFDVITLLERINELELGARRLLDASTWEDQENAMVEFEELLEE